MIQKIWTETDNLIDFFELIGVLGNCLNNCLMMEPVWRVLANGNPLTW
ncbi:hypothetical protein [Bifidobacterium thermacidophilum]